MADNVQGRGQPRHIGVWRLLDLATATMPFRAGLFAGATPLPEFGPPDASAPRDPADELPGSNIGEGERAQAVQRERAWRSGLR